MATLRAPRMGEERPGMTVTAGTGASSAVDVQDQHLRQVLVRLDNAKTYLLHVPTSTSTSTSTSTALLPQQVVLLALSAATSIPARHLRITTPPESPVWTDATPYVSASFHLPIRGGKGGFGTLLKGQSKQAGAKTTLDFGACRDLSGRRLRHINDEVKLRKWRDAQSRRDQGLPVDELEELRTESGIRNWHLMVPSWADGAASSNKARRKAEMGMQREVQRWQSAEEREKQKKEEAKLRQEMAVADYVRAGEAAAAAASLETTSKKDKVLEIMLQKKKNRKRGRDDGGEGEGREKGGPQTKRAFGGDETPSYADYSAAATDDDGAGSYLCTLSGDVVVDDVVDKKDNKSNSGKILLQSQSEFATAAVLLSRPLPADAKGLYYEVTIRTGGLAQIGWAYAGSGNAGGGNKPDASADLRSIRLFRPNSDTGDGVGDDDASFGYDGFRGLAFHAGEEKAVSSPASWKDGDVVGCTYDAAEGIVTYSLNGKDIGVEFKVEGESETDGGNDSAVKSVLFPAASLNQGEMVQINVGPSFSFAPKSKSGQIGVYELIDMDELSNDSIGEDDNVDAKKPATMTSVQSGASSAPKGPSTFGAITPGIMLPPVVAAHGKAAATAAVPSSEKVETSAEVSTNSTGKDEKKDLPPFDLDKCQSLDEAKQLGMDRLKEVLTSMGCKCGGSLDERAVRLFSLKGLKREDYPKKVRANPKKVRTKNSVV